MVTTESEAPPAAARVFELFMTYWTACAIRAAVNLGIPDAVGDTPRSAADIAAETEVDATSLARLLRGLAAAEIFREVSPQQFVHTPMSAALCRGAPGAAREAVRLFGLKLFHEGMAEYEYAIKTGRPALERVHGARRFFDLLSSRPAEAAVYNEGMSSQQASFKGIVDAIDFGKVKRLADVGGGTGELLASILARNPEQRGVLFDLASVVADAAPVLAKHGVTSRCTIEGGDMHAAIPPGCDGYVLKSILHGSPDFAAVPLLRRVHDAAAPGARLFIIENVMPALGERVPVCATFDLFLLMGGRIGGKVRSRADFEELLARTRFHFTSLTPIQDDLAVIEAVRLP